LGKFVENGGTASSIPADSKKREFARLATPADEKKRLTSVKMILKTPLKKLTLGTMMR
jgi:hypothetical protein